MDLNQRLPVTVQAAETLNPLNSGENPKIDNNQDVSDSLTNGHVPLPTSAFNNGPKPVKGSQVSQPTRISSEKHGEKDKQAAARGPAKKARPTTTNKAAHETLGPLDRLKAAKRSYEISKKVVGAARQCRSLDYHVKFLPEQRIPELVDSSSISLELTRSRKGSLMTYAPELFRKVQTILYLIDLPTKIRLFVSNNVCDADLPLELLPGTKESDKSITLRSIKHPEVQVTFRKRLDAEDFVKHQWSVLAYIFHPRTNAKVPHHKLRDDEILPFQGQKLVGRQGSSGKVFETRIHPDHHFWDWNKERSNKNIATCNKFAIKTLQSRDRSNFNQEVRVLRKLSKDRHRHSHLVTLLASYEQKQTFSLIFPLATHDLFGFWEAESYPRKTDSIARWIAEQCKGLAEGLSRIHRWQTFSGSSVISEEDAEYSETTPADDLASQDDTSPIDRTPRNYFGVHGDLKPENILWYPDPSRRGHGTLKITDFGIARFSKNYSRPGVMPNSPSYRSPEFEVLESHSPACDVWALGCTYLEFVTWFCGGQRALDEFGKQRLEHDEKFGEIKSDKFFAIYYSPEEPGVKQAKVKNSVATWLEVLLESPTCKQFAHFQELLKIVRDMMLVVHPTRPVTHNDGGDNLSLQKSQSGSGITRRKSSGQVADFLSSMSVFANDIEELSRQNTRDFNAASAGSEMIGSIPGILQASTSPPQSPTLRD